jgi:hypothetical protein
VVSYRVAPTDRRDHPTRSQVPLADGRWKPAFHRGFYGQAGRIQNHLFSLTVTTTPARFPAATGCRINVDKTLVSNKIIQSNVAGLAW